MSAIFINSTTSPGTMSSVKPHKVAPTRPKPNHQKSQPVEAPAALPQEEEVKVEEETEKSREERKATGRTIAIVIFLSLMCLALYHVVQKKTTILAGVLVPALILFSYLFFVIHVSQREKDRRRKQEEAATNIELSVQSDSLKMGLHKKISTVSNPSISSASLPSTSGLVMTSTIRGVPKGSLPKSSSLNKMDMKSVKILIDPKGIPPSKNSSTNAKKPFKKAQSQSHIQVKSNQSAHISIEHETKKLKKSRSFDRNNLVEPRHHMIDNKKIKTKH